MRGFDLDSYDFGELLFASPQTGAIKSSPGPTSRSCKPARSCARFRNGLYRDSHVRQLRPRGARAGGCREEPVGVPPDGRAAPNPRGHWFAAEPNRCVLRFGDRSLDPRTDKYSIRDRGGVSRSRLRGRVRSNCRTDIFRLQCSRS